MSHQIDFLVNMFPSLDRGVVEDVLNQQNGDPDKAIDELLNLAVGDDLFAKSVFIEDKLSASQHLRNFDTQQEQILRQCQERRAAEQRQLQEQQQQEAENRRRVEQEKQRRLAAEREAEEKAKQAVLQREAELRTKEENLLREKERMIAQQLEEEKARIARSLAEQEQLAKKELEAANALKRQNEEDRLMVEKEKAAVYAERKRIEEEKALLEAEKKRQEEEQNREPPKISIYTRKQMEEESGQHEKIATEIRSIFTSNGFKDSEIVVVDVSTDMELASFLKEICNNTETIKYPLVCAGRLPIGTLDEVQALVGNKDQLSSLHSGEYVPDFLTEEQANSLKDGTGTFVGRGVLDHCLDAAEYVVSGVGSLLWLPVNIVTYPFRSAKEELVKGPDDVDFDIVHTNWYWRNLQRRFRFTKDSILRINPAVNDVRAIHPFTTITTVRVVDEENFIINYDGGSSPDYVRAVPEFTSRMLELIKTRCATLGAKPVFIRSDDL